jgi:predicted AlkP superfamily pyrophosphatase or phosphodiesterase
VEHRNLALLAAALAAASPALAEPPRLVVQITFDQLRGDLLERYRPALSGGLKRVLDRAWWARRGDVAHGLTVSFPGHGTLATGMHPTHHGLTVNEYWERAGDHWGEVSVAADPTARTIGHDGVPGESPWRMEASSIGDWFKAASPPAKVIAIGSDAAIPYGGKQPDGTYWFDSAAGGFTTSTYYRASRPAWVEALNARIAALPRAWEPAVPQQWMKLVQHRSACPPFQPEAPWPVTSGRMLGPHLYRQAEGSYLSWVGSTPLADAELLAHAGDIVRAEAMGADSTPDYLNLTIGSTDSVGHEYGPVSLEQLDTVLRLDRALGEFLDDLDRSVGKGRYVVGISADHGVADPPEEHCIHRVTKAEIEALLDRVEALARAHKGSEAELKAAIIAELEKAPFVGEVYTAERLARAPAGDWKAQLMKRSFLPDRIPNFPLWGDKPREFHPARYGIFVQFKRGMIFDYARSVHGSPYDYDRWVPVVFYGAGVPRRTLASGARTADVAPTLAALAGVQMPRRLDGRVLLKQAAVTKKR